MLIYLDTNIVIYLVEQPPGLGPRATARINTLYSAGDQAAVSDLVRMECRVRPLALSDAVTLGEFDTFFASADVQVLALTAAVWDRAAEVRAQYRFRALVAIHLAAAVEHGCDVFLTNDVRLSSFPDVSVEVLP